MRDSYRSPSVWVFIRQHAVSTSVAFAGFAAFIVVSAYLLHIAWLNYDEMRVSQWVLNSDQPGEGDKAAETYDLTRYGVDIPPSREERAAQAKAENPEDKAETGGRDCYDEPEYLEASDLCAQWSNAAAMRFGNSIAAESYRLSYIVGFISALGVLLAAIGVILAAIASTAASRGVAMMAYGFMPILDISVRHHQAGFVRLTIKNVGTGPALAAVVEGNGEKVDLAHERFAVDTSETVDLKVDGDSLVVRASWRDLANEPQVIERLFIKVRQQWRLAEDQPSQSD